MATTPNPDLGLHGYFRSSAAYRVRIALHLKGLSYRHIGVHLLRGGGEQHSADYRKINPLGLVPVLHDGDFQLSQSVAIIEYLDDRYPAIRLVPEDIELRARARQFALTVACDIHPLNNPRVLKFLVGRFGADEADRQEWMRHWIEVGFEALDLQLPADGDSGRFCVGDTPTIADCCLIPQVFNAKRFGVDMSRFPAIERIAAACDELPAFQSAHPSRQPDAE
jgi:maleylpyruvate isomerase